MAAERPTLPATPRVEDRATRVFLDAVRHALEGYGVTGTGALGYGDGRSSKTFITDPPDAGVSVSSGVRPSALTVRTQPHDSEVPAVLICQYRAEGEEFTDETTFTIPLTPGQGEVDVVGHPGEMYDLRFRRDYIFADQDLVMSTDWSLPMQAMPQLAKPPKLDGFTAVSVVEGQGADRTFMVRLPDPIAANQRIRLQVWPEGRPGSLVDVLGEFGQNRSARASMRQIAVGGAFTFRIRLEAGVNTLGDWSEAVTFGALED